MSVESMASFSCLPASGKDFLLGYSERDLRRGTSPIAWSCTTSFLNEPALSAELDGLAAGALPLFGRMKAHGLVIGAIRTELSNLDALQSNRAV